MANVTLPKQITFGSKTFKNLEWETNSNMNGFECELGKVYPEFDNQEEADQFAYQISRDINMPNIWISESGNVTLSINA